MGKKNKAASEFQARVEDIQTEARAGFSLRDRLAGRNARTKDVTIYTDSVAGGELGYAEDQTDQYGLKTGKRLRKGLLGLLDSLEEEAAALLAAIDHREEAGLDPSEEDAQRSAEVIQEIDDVRSQIAPVRERLKATSLVFTLRTLPDIVVRDCRRKARLELEIKGKKIPESMLEDYNLEYVAQMLSASVERWVDNESGEKREGLSIAEARDLRDFLPAGQFPRLDEAMIELSFEAQIANQATDDADF